MVPNSLC